MASLNFNNVYLDNYFTLVGPKEKESNIEKYNLAMDEYYYKCKTFEDAEIKMQRTVIENLLKENNVDYIVGGDLINQIGVTSYGVLPFEVPFLGVYSACSSFIEGMIISSIMLDKNLAKSIITITSSHSLTAERQFRYPIEYGATRPSIATSTSTGSVGCTLKRGKGSIKVKGATIGKVVDLDIKDVNNMGAVMAPAAADTIYRHLKDNNLKVKDFDLILTGDLGKIGSDILKEYYENLYHEKLNNHKDAGALIYKENQDMLSGGSGPACLPLYFFGNIIGNKKYKKILLVGTGSLHNTTFVNQKRSIPSISHIIEIEVL